jgi:hypothetical protein
MPVDCPDFDSALNAWSTFYKRSLYATSMGKQENAKRPLGKSREAWYQVLTRYYEDPPAKYAADSRWQSDLAAITGHLHLGEWLTYSGDLEAAHEALEPVRRIWMKIRERNGVRWFGDELTRYHDVMEPVVLWGTGKVHGGVTEENVEEFEAEVAALAEAWRRVEQFGPPRATGMRRRRFAVFMSRESEAIADLQQVIAERRLEEVPEAARAVKNVFRSLYMGFG